MKIWVYLNDTQQGPYTLEELSNIPITASTPVWYDGLSQWLPASEAPATASLFSVDYQPEDNDAEYNPETVTTSQVYNVAAVDKPECPPTFIGWSIFVLICCFPIGGVLGIVFSSMTDSAYRSGDFERAKRMSEYSEWSIILSIVIGLLFVPLSIFLF